ncbi:MAG: metallophosphoesterase [Nitrososphaerota archaeon]
MLIGIISDTHDNLIKIREAVSKLNEMNVELVLHAGDFVSPFTIKEFQNLKSRMITVFGNNDGDKNLLTQKLIQINALVNNFFAVLDIDGLKIFLTHGDDIKAIDNIIKINLFDLLIRGHTHKKEVKKEGKTLIINPGEVCGYLSGESTIAIFNTISKEAKIISLE